MVRGPVSTVYGSGAIGGVVSFRTRTIDDILNPDETYGAVQRTGYGTNGAGIFTNSMVGARIGTAADVFGQFLYRNANNYYDGDDNKIWDTGSELTSGLFKFNVYPADLEVLLLKHPDVIDVAVIGVPSEQWGEQPLALVVRRDCGTASAEAIRDWANAQVSKTQRLVGVEFRDSLPRSTIGKIMKRELRAPYWEGRASKI